MKYMIITTNGTYYVYDEYSFSNVVVGALSNYGDSLIGVIKVDED